MLVPAKYAPALSVACVLGGYLLGIAFYLMSSRHEFFSLANLGAAYPSRPFVQVGSALSSTPRAFVVVLWYIVTRSNILGIVGFCRLACSLLSVYVTAADSRISGSFAMLYSCLTVVWMVLLSYFAAPNSPARSMRRKLTVLYGALFTASVHFLSLFLASGHGHWKFVLLRFVALGVDLWFELLAGTDFNNIAIRVDYSKYFGA